MFPKLEVTEKMLTMRLDGCCDNFNKEKCLCPKCKSPLQRIVREYRIIGLRCTAEECDFTHRCSGLGIDKGLHTPIRK